MLTVHSFVVGYIIGVACGILACRQHLVIILFPSVDRVCVRAVVCVSVVLCVCTLSGSVGRRRAAAGFVVRSKAVNLSR